MISSRQEVQKFLLVYADSESFVYHQRVKERERNKEKYIK